MKKTRKTYVEFFYSGVFFVVSSVEEVKSRNIKKLNIPGGAFGFIFFDIIETKIRVNGRMITLKSGRINVSSRHYYGGRIMTLKEVKAEMPQEKILISNMESNNWNRIIKCRTGNVQPFEKGNIYIKKNK